MNAGPFNAPLRDRTFPGNDISAAAVPSTVPTAGVVAEKFRENSRRVIVLINDREKTQRVAVHAGFVLTK